MRDGKLLCTNKSICSDPYRKVAGWYDYLFEPFLKKMRAEAEKTLPPRKNSRVLDVGCGTGSHLGRLARSGVTAFGLDRSPSMLTAAAQQLTGRISLTRGDAHQMPFPSAAFDFVLITMALHEMAPSGRSAVLDESLRSLCFNVLRLIVDYAWEPARSNIGNVLRWLSFCIEFIAGGAHYKNYRHFMSNKGLENLTAMHGLTVVRKVYIWHGNIIMAVIDFPSKRRSQN